MPSLPLKVTTTCTCNTPELRSNRTHATDQRYSLPAVVTAKSSKRIHFLCDAETGAYCGSRKVHPPAAAAAAAAADWFSRRAFICTHLDGEVSTPLNMPTPCRRWGRHLLGEIHLSIMATSLGLNHIPASPARGGNEHESSPIAESKLLSDQRRTDNEVPKS